ncbi:SPRY domain-containing protein [Pseudoxanthomonas indica]|uniref:SPRY domain-containing protein n=1 Tax=Pseudoxanthomonas indica TaxID=428993 RepID=A0A1T5JZK8_9GAMM|nr:SPRY domain-containing protein [Pseudoxanthomonas indica]GGD45655.1 hypothetical protein GCM10007235_16970 [Pseudoxanthomonas indica]SKC56992.1 SPRY domain-containing protein [Pseudoxanthomonas indica]
MMLLPAGMGAVKPAAISGGVGSGFTATNLGSNVVLSNGNRTAAFDTTATTRRAHGSQVRSTTGKYYFEFLVDLGSGATLYRPALGISGGATAITNLGGLAGDYGYLSNGEKRGNAGSSSSFGASFTTGDIIGVAVDFAAGQIWYAKNNVWQGGGNPAAGTSPAFSGVAGNKQPTAMVTSSMTAQVTIRTDTGSQSYAPPAGFVPWG